MDVGVYLGGFHPGVSEHLLDIADVGAPYVHRCGAGVAEQMAGSFDGDSSLFHLSGHPITEVARGNAGAVPAQEHSGFMR